MSNILRRLFLGQKWPWNFKKEVFKLLYRLGLCIRKIGQQELLAPLQFWDYERFFLLFDVVWSWDFVFVYLFLCPKEWSSQ